MDYRIEKDSMGEMKVPVNAYWGAQTQRSFENFKIGAEKMPKEITYAFAILKKAVAQANFRLGKLDERRCEKTVFLLFYALSLFSGRFLFMR